MLTALLFGFAAAHPVVAPHPVVVPHVVAPRVAAPRVVVGPPRAIAPEPPIVIPPPVVIMPHAPTPTPMAVPASRTSTAAREGAKVLLVFLVVGFVGVVAYAAGRGRR